MDGLNLVSLQSNPKQGTHIAQKIGALQANRTSHPALRSVGPVYFTLWDMGSQNRAPL